MQLTPALVLVTSQFVEIVQNTNRAVIWHSLFGRPKFVSLDTLELLRVFEKPHSIKKFLSEYDIGKDGEATIRNLVEDYFLIPANFEEREFLENITKDREGVITDGSLVDRLELIMSEECNFRCIYCIHFCNLGTSNRINSLNKFMTFEVAKKTIDEYIRILKQHGKKNAKIGFCGGEPLLVWPVIERIVNYYRANYESAIPCSFSIVSNSSLITREIAAKLNRYNISVASSLDGLGNVNDSVRTTKSGKGTFEAIINGLDNLKECEITADVAITVTEQNFAQIDEQIIDWAAARGMDHLRISPDVINLVSVPIDKIVVWLIRLRKYGKKVGVNITGCWNRAFGNFNYSALDGLTAFCNPSCGTGISVNPAGYIYGCCYSTNMLGNIRQIDQLFATDGPYQKMVIQHLVGRLDMCKGCMIEGQCIGGCEITREFVHSSKNLSKMRQNCDLSRRMTRELFLEQISE